MDISKNNISFNIFIGLLMVLTTSIGFLYLDLGNLTSSFWPAAGFYVSIYFIFRKRALPGIFIGVLLTNLSWLLIMQDTVLEALLITIVMTLSNMIAMYSFAYVLDFLKADVKKLNLITNGNKFLSAVVVSSVIGGLIGTIGTFLVRGYVDFYDIFTRWSFGDFLGMLVFGSLVFNSYYKDKEFILNTKDLIKSIVFLVSVFIIGVFVFSSTGNDFITFENFQISIFILYLIASVVFTYRMILSTNLILLSLIYALRVRFIEYDQYVFEAIMISVYLVSLSSIATLVRNVIYDRQKSLEELSEAKFNLERLMMSTNSLLEANEVVPEEIDNFTNRYLNDMFNLAFDIYPKFDRGSFYIKGDKYVEFISVRGYDLDFLNELKFKADEFIWQYDYPEIFNNLKATDYIYTDNNLSKYVEKFGHNKESIRFSIKIDNQVYGCMSFDILSSNPESFDQSDAEAFHTFHKLINSYYMFGKINQENNILRDDILRSSVQTLELFDSYTESHSDEVSKLSLEIGRLLNLSDKDLRELYWASLVHDIGKIGVSTEVLNKNGKLTSEEYSLVKEHSNFGYKVLSKTDSLKDIAISVKHHHEWWNGTGYPDGLRGDSIPFHSQIIHICDAVSAMSNKRVYKDAMKPSEIIEQLEQGKGIQFNESLATLMIHYIKRTNLKILKHK